MTQYHGRFIGLTEFDLTLVIACQNPRTLRIAACLVHRALNRREVSGCSAHGTAIHKRPQAGFVSRGAAKLFIRRLAILPVHPRNSTTGLRLVARITDLTPATSQPSAPITASYRASTECESRAKLPVRLVGPGDSAFAADVIR